MCNCPLFVDTHTMTPVGVMAMDMLKASWDMFYSHGFKAPDMDAMNISFIQCGMHDRIVKLPGLQWLGTNEQHLKTYTKATLRERDGLLWLENGLEIWSFHGQYYHETWCRTQLHNRRGCIKGRLDGSEKSMGDAISALNTLKTAFFHYLDEGPITIEHRDYRHEEMSV
jgi:hypothetical protein